MQWPGFSTFTDIDRVLEAETAPVASRERLFTLVKGVFCERTVLTRTVPLVRSPEIYNHILSGHHLVPQGGCGCRRDPVAVSGIFLQRFEMRLEPNLRDERGHNRTADHGRHQYGVLRLIDDVVGETEQCGNRTEG